MLIFKQAYYSLLWEKKMIIHAKKQKGRKDKS